MYANAASVKGGHGGFHRSAHVTDETPQWWPYGDPYDDDVDYDTAAYNALEADEPYTDPARWSDDYDDDDHEANLHHDEQ